MEPKAQLPTRTLSGVCQLLTQLISLICLCYWQRTLESPAVDHIWYFMTNSDFLRQLKGFQRRTS